VASAVYGRFVAERRAWPHEAGKREVRIELDGISIEDWLADLRADNEGRLAAFLLSPSNVLDAEGVPRAHRLVMPWVDHLVAQAAGLAVVTRYIGPDATIVLEPLAADDAMSMLTTLVRAWRAGMDTPRPVAVKTALAWLRARSPEEAPQAARAAYEATHERAHGELDGDPYLLRAFPHFAALIEAGFAECLAPYRDFLGALRVEVA
jgi:exodeoxyribonuclease V gamma subunit